MLKNKKIIIATFILLTVIVTAIYVYNLQKKEKVEKERINVINKTIEDIKIHYNLYVMTNKEAKIYKLESSNYVDFGEVGPNVYLELGKVNITQDTKYFYIPSLDAYIYYEDVDSCGQKELNDRYKNYIYFNTNILTQKPTNFYDDKDNLIYSLDDSFEFKVIVNMEDKYGIEFNNQLLYIKKNNVSDSYSSDNTTQLNRNRIMTLTYHFIYDPNENTCNDSICQTLDMFESHLKYLRENDYFTLKLNELEMYMDGYIQIPQKSIVLTIDDGTLLNQKALKLLEDYQANATLFVITGWVDPSQFKSGYLDLESHTDKMHNQYECAGMGNQGGGILCLPEETVLSDLKTCQDKLGGSIYFSYPFFDFNDRAISLLKQAGYHMAFIGQYDTNGYSYPGVTDKFKIRRKTIFSSTSMDEFISFLK